jgi:hypothetical protein
MRPTTVRAPLLPSTLLVLLLSPLLLPLLPPRSPKLMPI